jgi:L-asparaginase
MARQADGQAWDGDGVAPQAPAERSRQPFYPDASRVFEEIDRLGIDEDGVANMLSSKAEFERLLLMACLLKLGSVRRPPTPPTRRAPRSTA